MSGQQICYSDLGTVLGHVPRKVHVKASVARVEPSVKIKSDSKNVANVFSVVMIRDVCADDYLMFHLNAQPSCEC